MSKLELFRKVYTKDRMPLKEGSYISCSKSGVVIKRNYYTKQNSFCHNNWAGDLVETKGIEWFLEEYED